MTKRRESRRRLETRAPKPGTVIAAAILYVAGLFGVLGFFNLPDPWPTAALAASGGLLLLGAFLRDL